MLWCSYFKSFIKSINLNRCGNFIEKFNFVSTPSKIIIPIAHNPLNTTSPMPPPTTSSPTHHIPHYRPTTHHLTTPKAITHPQRKSRALMPNILWAPSHSLPIHRQKSHQTVYLLSKVFLPF